MEKLKWLEIKSIVKSFELEGEPECIHVIKTGHFDTYIVVYEDAYELSLGKVFIGSKKDVETKFNIEL